MKIGKKHCLISLTCLAASLSLPVIAQTVPQAIATENKAVAKPNPIVPANQLSASQPVSANATPVRLYCENHAEVIVAGGIAGVHTRDSHMHVTSTETDTLAQTNSYRWDAGDLQLGMGYVFYWVDGPRLSDELRWFPTFEPRISLFYSNLSVHGDIYQFNNIFLDNIRYTTSISNTRLLVDGVLTIVSQCKYSLYGLLGVGLGWSTLNYHDKLGPNTRIDLVTERESNTVWEFGAGINYVFNRKVSASLEYVWTDLGRMSTSSRGAAYGVTSPELQGASFQVTTQAVLLGLHIALG